MNFSACYLKFTNKQLVFSYLKSELPTRAQTDKFSILLAVY